MIVDHFADDRQAKAGAFLPRRKERIKNSSQILTGNSSAIIFHNQMNLRGICKRKKLQENINLRILLCMLNSIFEKVDQDLLHLIPIDINGRNPIAWNDA